MCGIIGVYPFKLKPGAYDVSNDARSFIQRYLFVESLVRLEDRGKDATGIALLWRDFKALVAKQPVNSSFFAMNDGLFTDEYNDPKNKDAHFAWAIHKWINRGKSEVAQVLGHVRAKTKGSELNTFNNHPIIINDKESTTIGENTIIGVHNGSVRNDDALVKKYDFKRMGEVDSEIIFHMLDKYKDNLDEKSLIEIFNELDGLFAVLAFNTSKPNMVYGLREERPIELGYIKEIGTMIAISDKKFLDPVFPELDRWRVREDIEGKLPYLGKIEWLKTIDTGVFTMDLDTEVDGDTKPADLLQFKHVKKETKPVSGYGVYHTPTGAVGTTVTPGTTGTTGVQTPASTTADTQPGVKAIDKRASVVDLSDYQEEKKEDKEALMDDLLKQEGIPLGEGATGENDFEIEIVHEDEELADATEEDSSGHTFKERVALGSHYLHNTIFKDGNIDPEMFLAKDVKEQKEELAKKFSIKVKADDQLLALLALIYDHAFPEGYACGLSDGYSLCEEDYSDEDSAKLVEKFKEKIKKLEKGLDIAKRMIVKTREERNKIAEEYKRVMAKSVKN